jgi:hypothetical protein
MPRVDTEGILLVRHVPRDAPSGRALTVPWIGFQVPLDAKCSAMFRLSAKNGNAS